LTTHFTGVGQGDREPVLHLSLALLHLIMARPELKWQQEKTSPAISRAAHQVETEFATSLLIGDLARYAGLSVRRFSEAFKKQQGVSPGHFITMVRVREAARMLTHTEDSIEQIAEKSGFPNRHYFSRVFKRLTRDSPAHFRQKHSGQAIQLEPSNRAVV
jgi:transcriptional regulator GlxA family with amidase domain